MAPIHIILLLFVLQIATYIGLDKYKLSYWKYLVLAVCLILNFLILPSYFIPDYKEGEIRCGMPALGITLAFWVLGGGLTIITHCIYSIINSSNRMKRQSQLK